MNDLKTPIRKSLFWTAVTLVIAAAAVLVFFVVVPAVSIPVSADELYGNYRFEKQVYINGLSSFLAYERYEEYYTLTKDKLTITLASGKKRNVDIGYEFSEVSEQGFKDMFLFDTGAPDISQYKQRYQYTLKAAASGVSGYTLYLMDGEVWLASVNSGKFSDRYIRSICSIEAYGGELSSPPAVTSSVSASSESPAIFGEIYVDLHLGGDYIHGLCIKDENQKQIVEDAVLNCLLKSAAWEGVDIESLDDYIVIHARYKDKQEEAELFVFDKDGMPCMQFGRDGMYSILNDEPYMSLRELALGYYLPGAMTVISGDNSIFALGSSIWTEKDGLSADMVRLKPQQVADHIQILPIKYQGYLFAAPFTPYINGEIVEGEYTVYDMHFNPVKVETPPFTSYVFEWPQTDRRLIFDYVKNPGKYIVELETTIKSNGAATKMQYFFGVILPESPQGPLK